MALPSGHRVQLDGLRAVAVLMVAFGHWFGEEHFSYEPRWSYIGVQLFFVLSGYLITGILLGVRSKVAERSSDWRPPVGAFFVRRLLRLVPALYVYLIVTSLFGYFGDVEGLPWYFLYLGNFRWAMIGGSPLGAIHLWSLAVEEQFYLFVPFVVLLARRMRVMHVFGLLLAGSVFSSFAATTAGIPTILPPSAFTGLLVGCVLATVVSDNVATDSTINRFGAVSALAYLLAKPVGNLVDLGSWASLSQLFLTVAIAAVVWSAARGESRLGQLLLTSRPVRWLGSVSYGFYLWHVVAKEFAVRQIPDFLNGLPMALQFGLLLGLSLVPTALSFYTVERIGSSLKHRVPYLKPAVTRQVNTSRERAEALT